MKKVEPTGKLLKKKGWDKDCGVYQCSDGIHLSWWLAIRETKQWKDWAKYATRRYDISEVEECGWMSVQHARAFLNWVQKLK